MKLMFRLLLAASVFAGALAPAPAQELRKIFPYRYVQEDLPNGLRLISTPTDYPNLAAVYIVVRTGSRNEVEPGKSGFAHLFEHLMFRGTEKFPTSRYEETMKKAGAASNAYTSDDLTVYHTTFSKEDLETVLGMEADRFQNLKVSPAEFQTETQAVLGEYNKNSSNPEYKLEEVLRETAFDRHTYRHTTMGFLKDIQDMPNQYEYSLKFFDRYYRPEYTTIVVAGDIEPKKVRALVDRYWGGWKRGSFEPQVPADPAQEAPRKAHVNWPNPTLPWVVVSWRAPAYSDTDLDSAALDLVTFVGFSENSELYQKLVIQEQKVDMLGAFREDHIDPYLFSVYGRVKKPADVEYVRDQILATVERLRSRPVDAARLEAVKNNVRYSFSLGLDDSQSVAAVAARYVALRRTPETINDIYDLYAKVTPTDLQRAASRHLGEKTRTIVTLSGAAAAASGAGK
ncbi:MAG: insulinase family protein [Acidobacteria bacterium]|nr:insulinase family protein [Acidobacteriota bacterium]